MTKTRFLTLFGILLVFAAASGGCSSPGATRTRVQVEGWQDTPVRSVCLTVKEVYPDGYEPYISSWEFEGISGAIKSILIGLGLDVETEEGQCDATLTYQLEFSGLSQEYWFGGVVYAGQLYTGARVDGLMELSAPDREPITRSIVGVFEPPPEKEVSIDRDHQPTRPEDAPFGRAWPEPVVDSLAYLWGPQALVQAVVRPTEGAVMSLLGAEKLGYLGSHAPEEAIPALIDQLDADARYGSSAALIEQTCSEALRKITGQDHGTNAARWRQWWEAQ